MKSGRRSLLLGAAAVLGGVVPATAAVPARPLRIVTSHLPPLVLERADKRGVLCEMVDELCRRLNLDPALQFMPWNRAVFMAARMSATAIFPLTRTHEREAQYRWLAPLYEEKYVFLAARTSRFDVSRPADMKDKRIAMMRGSAQVAIIRSLGYNTIVEARSIEEVHRYLLAGMADAAFGETAIIQSSLVSWGGLDDFHTSEPVRRTTAWLAGSLDFTEADAAQYARVMKEMVADGTHLKILKRYRLA